MVWMAHHETIERRGKIQTLIYIMREIGRFLISIVIILGFSGPETACPGYESDLNAPCTTDESVTSRNDQFESNPDDWCHVVCDAADFPFGLTIPQFVWIIASVNIISIPAYFLLYEEKRAAEKVGKVLSAFWQVMKKRAVWMLVLYTMISSITFNVYIAAKVCCPFESYGFVATLPECPFLPNKYISFLSYYYTKSEQRQLCLARAFEYTEPDAGNLRKCSLRSRVDCNSTLWA